MKNPHFRKACMIVASLLILGTPISAQAKAKAKADAAPPVAPPIVREGDLAVRLAAALGVATTNDEAEAESRLGDIGIAPRNGWIADYPVTPDIVGELQESVGATAASRKIPLSRSEAMEKVDEAKASLGVALRPAAENAPPEAEAAAPKNYPNTTIINNYYSNSGPPVVTYYAPPLDFLYLYAWVPFPFWGYGFWFPGFYVLHDFHRVVIMHDRIVRISNHFNDERAYRVFRIDPESRFHGRTFSGIGAPRSRGYIHTGVAGSEHRIFNPPREWNRQEHGAAGREHGGHGGDFARPSHGGEHGGEHGGIPGGGREGGHSGGSGVFAPSSHGGEHGGFHGGGQVGGQGGWHGGGHGGGSFRRGHAQ